jgi:hypothetical protein
MHQPPQKLIRQTVNAVAGVMLSEHLPPNRQETLRLKAKALTLRVEKAMGARDPEEKLIVWEELNLHAFNQNRRKELHNLRVEGY